MTPDDLPPALRQRVAAVDGHWLWTGSMNSNGYGQMQLGGKPNRRHWLAHRLVYTVLVGDPGDKQLHHRPTCPLHCVHPDHLTPLTPTEHSVLHSTLDECRRGHSMEDAYVRRGGGRMCRQCVNARQRAWQAKQTPEKRAALIAARTERRRRQRLRVRASDAASVAVSSTKEPADDSEGEPMTEYHRNAPVRPPGAGRPVRTAALA